MIETGIFPAQSKDVLYPYEFLTDFEEEALKAKKSVTVQSMYWDPDQFGSRVLTLFRSLPQSVNKTFFADYYSHMVADSQILGWLRLFPFTRNKYRELSHQKKAFFENLRDADTQVHITNQSGGFFDHLLPIYNRDHMKGASIDEGEVFYFGKLNFADVIAQKADFMVKFQGQLGHTLSHIFDRIHQKELKRDQRIELDELDCVYFDAGTKGKSIILAEAVEMIGQAYGRVDLLSTFVPDGPVARALHAFYKENKGVQLVTSQDGLDFSQPFSMGNLEWLANRLNVWHNARTRTRFPYQKYPFGGVHGTLLVIDGKKAMITTHNLSEKGVIAGTKEWALVTEDPELIQNLMARFGDFAAESNEAALSVL